MFDWWGLLSLELQIFYAIAMVSTLVLVLQSLALIFGIGDDADADADADGGGGAQIVSSRTIIAFMVGFGWTGVIALRSGMSIGVSIIAAGAVGAIFMLAVFALMRGLYSFRQSGTLDYQNAVGEVATVYLTIPPKTQSPGQVEVMVQGRLKIVQAYTKGESEIPSRAKVKVVGLLDKQSVLVEPLG